jgi:hypothetical protein
MVWRTLRFENALSSQTKVARQELKEARIHRAVCHLPDYRHSNRVL